VTGPHAAHAATIHHPAPQKRAKHVAHCTRHTHSKTANTLQGGDCNEAGVTAHFPLCNGEFADGAHNHEMVVHPPAPPPPLNKPPLDHPLDPTLPELAPGLTPVLPDPARASPLAPAPAALTTPGSRFALSASPKSDTFATTSTAPWSATVSTISTFPAHHHPRQAQRAPHRHAGVDSQQAGGHESPCQSPCTLQQYQASGHSG
jgi:hypothetical protein